MSCATSLNLGWSQNGVIGNGLMHLNAEVVVFGPQLGFRIQQIAHLYSHSYAVTIVGGYALSVFELIHYHTTKY